MKCPKCHSLLPDDAAFCDSCGTALKAKPKGAPSKFTFGPKIVNSNHLPSTNPIIHSPSRSSQSIPWYNRITFNWNHVQESWMQKLLRKCIFSTVITLAIAILILVIKIWPGCLISASLLLFAIATTIMSFVIQVPDVSGTYENEEDEKRVSNLLNHLLNMILIWEAFWLTAGLVCLAFTWWAVLIAEFFNLFGLFFLMVAIYDEL